MVLIQHYPYFGIVLAQVPILLLHNVFLSGFRGYPLHGWGRGLVSTVEVMTNQKVFEGCVSNLK